MLQNVKRFGKFKFVGKGKKKKISLRYIIDCIYLVEDGIMDVGNFVCINFFVTILELNFIVLCLEIDYEFVLSCLLNLYRQ